MNMFHMEIDLGDLLSLFGFVVVALTAWSKLDKKVDLVSQKADLKAQELEKTTLKLEKRVIAQEMATTSSIEGMRSEMKVEFRRIYDLIRGPDNNHRSDNRND